MSVNRLIVGVGACVAVLCGTTLPAAAVPLNWMNMAPTPFGTSVPNNSVYTLPGIGNVTVSYAFTGTFADSRFQNPLLLNGNVSANAYTWGNQELFAATNLGQTGQPSNWRITYTFTSLLPGGSIYLGVSGLGRTTNNGGMMTVASVNQNGTYLGDWSGGGNYGLTQFTGGPGVFSLNNSVTGAGGADPWWNTSLAVIRIDDQISSLTVNFSQLEGDGLGLNIASVPAPGAAALLGLGAAAALRRRRR
jgi:hypothetical protein